MADGKICFGLSAIKGCGGAAAGGDRRRARTHGGPYRSLFDFCERLDPGTVNRTADRIADQGRGLRLARRPAVRSCSRPSIAPCRPAPPPPPIAAAARWACSAATRTNGPRPLAKDLPDVPEWDQRDRLAKEKEVLGFYLSSHPLAEHAEDAHRLLLAHHGRGGRTEAPHRSRCSAACSRRSSSRTRRTPSRAAPAATRCSTWKTPRASCAASSGPISSPTTSELIQPDAIVVVRGAIDKRPGSEEANLIVNEIIPLDDLAARYTRGVRDPRLRGNPRPAEARTAPRNPPRLSRRRALRAFPRLDRRAKDHMPLRQL